MNDTLDLFPPASRNTDPVTSHQAEREITDKGERGKQCRAVFQLVRIYPGYTSRELAERSGVCGLQLDRYQVARRLSDLEAQGKVRKGQIVACRISLRQCVTWYPANTAAADLRVPSG